MQAIATIIPAFNAERTIENTVRNVLCQTLRDVEVWATDDGSVDKTGEILDRLAKEDSRVHVIHQMNGGAYRARLSALRRIDTPYFGFVDADDTIAPEMFETMLKIADSENADVVECGWQCNGQPGMIARRGDIIERLESREDVLARYVMPTLVGCGFSAYLWNKVYKNQYDFKSWLDGDFGSYEDLIHNLQLFGKVRSYVRISDKFYHYAPTDSSITRKFNSTHIAQLVNAAKAKRELIRAFLPESEIDNAMHSWLTNEKRNYAKKAIISAHGNPFAMLRNLMLVCKMKV